MAEREPMTPEEVIRFTAGIEFEPPITVEEAVLVSSCINMTPSDGSKKERQEFSAAKLAIFRAPEEQARGIEVDPRLVQLNSLVDLLSRFREQQYILQGNRSATSD